VLEDPVRKKATKVNDFSSLQTKKKNTQVAHTVCIFISSKSFKPYTHILTEDFLFSGSAHKQGLATLE
jgi:hypothetical protein